MKLKKLLALLIASAFALTAVACGGAATTAPPKASQAPSSAAASEAPSSAPAEVMVGVDGVIANLPAVGVDPASWKTYDELISKIRFNTNLEERRAEMHQAEDMLMSTGALLPIYYYNDIFMAKAAMQGYFTNAYGYKYFMFATNGDKDALRMYLASEPDKLDPALNTTVDGAILAVNSFSGLYTFNAEHKVVPDLAADTKVSDDKKTYTFTLKDDLKWSDGSPLTAKDFEYAWKRAADPETGSDYGYLFESIDGSGKDINVKASEDGKTLTVVLKSPTAYFLDLCTFPVFMPVKQEAVEAAAGYKAADGKIENPGAWATEAGFVTSGAYTLKEWKHNESMVYEKNPNYHRASEVKIERLELILTDEVSTAYGYYKSGDLDLIDDVPTDEIKGLLKNPEFHIDNQLGTYYAIFNVKSKLFEGKTPQQAANMRKALALLVDRQYITENIAQTGQKVATSFIPLGMNDGAGGEFKSNGKGYDFPVGDGYYSTDPNVEVAIQLLESAGFKFDGGKLSAATPLAFEYVFNTNPNHQKIAEALQQDFKEIGINMTIKNYDWKIFLNMRKEGKFDMARNGWIADYNDPINMLEMWTTGSGNNDAQFGR